MAITIASDADGLRELMYKNVNNTYEQALSVSSLPSTPTVTWTQTIVSLTGATTVSLIAANPIRKAIRWMNIGLNPMTVVPGTVTVVTVNLGMNYNGSFGTGQQGGSDSFSGELSRQAFSAFSTVGTSAVIWEGI
jgi:hypothetical protein